jgi:hypothetical protein
VVYGANHRAGQLGETGPPRPYVVVREGDPKGWSTVLITALGSWEKPVPRSHHILVTPFDPCSDPPTSLRAGVEHVPSYSTVLYTVPYCTQFKFVFLFTVAFCTLYSLPYCDILYFILYSYCTVLTTVPVGMGRASISWRIRTFLLYCTLYCTLYSVLYTLYSIHIVLFLPRFPSGWAGLPSRGEYVSTTGRRGSAIHQRQDCCQNAHEGFAKTK